MEVITLTNGATIVGTYNRPPAARRIGTAPLCDSEAVSMEESCTDLTIGIEASLDKTWIAGMLYIRNVVYALATLPDERQPRLRLLPIDADSLHAVEDLARTYSFVSVAAPGIGHAKLLNAWLFIRRVLRRIQYHVDRQIVPAFRGLSVSFPDWGKPVPGTPQIAWIPDFQHVHLPQMFSSDEVRRRTERVARIASSKGTLVLSSESAKQDFLRIHPARSVDVRVWRFCSTITEPDLREWHPQRALELPTFYLYVANQFWAHKGHLTLFEALCLLRKDNITPAVVCTGLMNDPRNPKYAQKVRDFLREKDLTRQVTLLGVIDRDQQIQVLRRAAAVIQPSMFEGWSTVVEDARAVGRPVLLSDIPVHREQLPDGEFFKAGDGSSLANSLVELLPRLQPGPDQASELLAQQKCNQARQKAGWEFLSIADTARKRRRPRGTS